MTLSSHKFRTFTGTSLSVFFLLINIACGGQPSGTTNTQPPLTITTPETAATLNAGSSITFSATVNNASTTAVSWSVQEGATGGSIASTGVYTAPATPGTYHVIATAQADPSKSAIITVTVIPALSISIGPASSVTLGPTQTETFTATVTNSIGTTVVTWSVREVSGGSITTSGVYTAPATPGTYHVIATSQVDTSKSVTATVTIVPVSVTIGQQTATLLVGQSQTFTAAVNYASDTTVVWSVQESFGGAVTSAGVYTAPSKAGTYHVIATSAADSNASATISIVVNGMITTVAGGGTSPYPGDNGLATGAQLKSPNGIAVDRAGNLYIVDHDGFRLRKVDAVTGVITTVAGIGTQGTSEDNGLAANAQLYGPVGVSVDASANLYIADFGWVREVSASTGVITTVAGRIPAYGFSGDGGPATTALLFNLFGIALDSNGNLFISDSGNQRIREVEASSAIIITFAGNGTQGYGGDNGLATGAMLNYPGAITVDKAGNLYICDTLNNVIRKVAASDSIITTFAGTGATGYQGDAGPATSATLYSPSGVVVDANGNVYISDAGNNVIRKVSASTGIISTVAGNGIPGYSGDGGNPTTAQLKNPSWLALDSAGNLYVTDFGNGVVRKIEW